MEAYLRDGAAPLDPKIAFPLIGRAKHFITMDGILFKKSFGSPLLRYLGPGEAKGALREIHEGCCDSHLGGRALASKVILVSYFWPTLNQDVVQMVKVC